MFQPFGRDRKRKHEDANVICNTFTTRVKNQPARNSLLGRCVPTQTECHAKLLYCNALAPVGPCVFPHLSWRRPIGQGELKA